MSATIEVKWNGKQFPVEFASVRDLEKTTVKELKSYIQRVTGISDTHSMKLSAFGALMNNDDMPLSIYGLRPGCYITLKLDTSKAHHNKESHKQQQQQDREVPAITQNNKQQNDPKKHSHSHHQHHHHHRHNTTQQQQPVQLQQSSATTASSGEEKLVQDLQLIKDKLYMEITPQVKKYEKDVKEFLSPGHVVEESLAKEKKKHFYMGAYLGEQLMHVFFDLDAFVCGPDNLNARQKRKELVKQAQALLDKVDEIKSLVKNVVVPEEN